MFGIHRILFALGRAGYIPQFFSLTWTRRNTPWVAILTVREEERAMERDRKKEDGDREERSESKSERVSGREGERVPQNNRRARKRQLCFLLSRVG